MFIPTIPTKPPQINQTFIQSVKKDIPRNCYVNLPPLESGGFDGIFTIQSGATGTASTGSTVTTDVVANYVPQTGVIPSHGSELFLGNKKMEQEVETRKSG